MNPIQHLAFNCWIASTMWTTAGPAKDDSRPLFGAPRPNTVWCHAAPFSSDLGTRFAGQNADLVASGKARSQFEDDRARFKVEVEDIASVGAGAVLTVKVDGVTVGTLTLKLNPVTGTPGGRLNLDTKHGNAVPDAKAGARVEIFTAGGALVLTGDLAPE